MKLIYLTRNYTTEVDDDVYEEIKHLKWKACVTKSHVYAGTILSKTTRLEFLHWFVVGVPLAGLVVDHIDSNSLNNKRSNLRVITYRQNCAKNNANTTGFPGVNKLSGRDKYQAQIRVNQKSIYLGISNNPVEAFTWYRKAVHDLGEVLLPEHEELWKISNIERNF